MVPYRPIDRQNRIGDKCLVSRPEGVENAAMGTVPFHRLCALSERPREHQFW